MNRTPEQERSFFLGNPRAAVERGLQLLAQGLAPFAEREWQAKFGSRWAEQVAGYAEPDKTLKVGRGGNWDPWALLKAMQRTWSEVFTATLGPSERNYLHEAINLRNDWAHNQPIVLSRARRGLDTFALLLEAVIAAEQHAGRQVRDVSAQRGLGYDIESLDTEGQLRFLDRLHPEVSL